MNNQNEVKLVIENGFITIRNTEGHRPMAICTGHEM